MPAVRMLNSVLKRMYNNKKLDPSAKESPQPDGQSRKTTRYTKVNQSVPMVGPLQGGTSINSRL